jgi:hypothetical protein
MEKELCHVCLEQKENVDRGYCPECMDWICGYEQILEETISSKTKEE